METWIGNFAVTWITNHHQYFQGIMIGVVLSNPGLCARLLFNTFVKVPGVGRWIARNPEKAKAWFDGFTKAIDAAVDKYDKEHPEMDDAPPVVPPAPKA